MRAPGAAAFDRGIQLALGTAPVAGAAVLLWADLPERVTQQLALWGPGLLVILMGFYIVQRFGPPFIEAQKGQAVAMTRVADALGQLPQKEDLKFEALATGQEVMVGEIRGLRRDVMNLMEKIDERS